MVAAPEVNGVTRVETRPVSSLRTVQLVAPAQAEKFTGGDAVRKTLAPLTGVAASARTCTRIGFGASPPMGVAGLEPLSSLIASDGPAPTVRTFDIEDEPPVAGSLKVMFCRPSGIGGAVAISSLADADKTDALVAPIFAAVFGRKPMP